MPQRIAMRKEKEWEKAKERYNEKSFWGKAKHILKGEHPRSIEKRGRNNVSDLYR